jgi:hypothetical protein
MAMLEWLAAALSPADIAPHPNFFSSEQITEVSIFALVCSARWDDVNRAIATAPDLDLTDVYLARDAMTTGESRRAAERITRIVYSRAAGIDPAKDAALTLIASMAYCELDMYQAAFSLLNFAIEQLERNRTADQNLLLAALYQQLAVRQYDYGANNAAIRYATEAQNHIQSLDVSSLSSFPLSHGVGWSSATTVRDISEAITAASSWLILAARGPFSEGWQDIVRRRPGFLDFRALQGTAEAFSSFVNNAFELRVPSDAITFGQSNMDSQLYATLLGEELLGSPSAHSVRNDLGKVRFLQSFEANEPSLLTDSINLLRQGRDYRRLREVIGHVRASGPLRAMAECAQQIMAERDPSSFAIGELIVLRASADQLDSEIAGSYYPKIVQIFSSRKIFSLQDLAFAEEGFLAAAEFANVTESPTGFPEFMLEIYRRLRGQEPYEIAIARALRAYDNSKITEEERVAWTSFLQAEYPRDPSVAAAVIGVVFDVDMTAGFEAGQTATLQSVANHVDQWRRHGRQIPVEVIDAAEPILQDSLRSIQEDAHQGRFAGGLIDTAAAAVAIAQYSGRQQLWSQLASFLSDSSIQRADTRNAFEFISTDPVSVPEVTRNRLAANRNEVLYSAPEMLSSIKVSPYPSALNCFISLRIIPVPEIITEISALAGSGMEAARAAACTALATYAAHGNAGQIWVSVLALQLSKDASATVRAQAGRTLAAQLGPEGELRPLVLIRMNALLGEDGLAVPLNLLRGLATSNQILDAELISRVQQLATGSVSCYIRKAASKLLDQQRTST